MTDREKLTELLEQWMQFETAENHTDYLLANGVTFQTWIPVAERLPDEDTLVLCVGAKGGMFLGYVCWLIHDKTVAYTSVPNSRGGRYAKYWMPLPEPPKEE